MLVKSQGLRKPQAITPHIQLDRSVSLMGHSQGPVSELYGQRLQTRIQPHAGQRIHIDVAMPTMSLPRFDRTTLSLQLLESCWTLAERRSLQSL